MESIHEVAACTADAAGSVLDARGDVERRVYVRSAAKPFIAAAIVQSGAAERFGLDARELAVIAASHNGEPQHVAVVAGILKKIGLSAGDLQCGAHAPSYEPAAHALTDAHEPFTAMHNNCSGKHAGILAMCVALGFEYSGYLSPDHPAQKLILAFCGRMVGEEPAAIPIGVDGCGIPVFATPLRRAALAFARLATLRSMSDEDAAALERVRRAMAAEPWYVAGTGRLDTAIMEATSGRIVCKAGAEGVHGDALLEPGLGAAFKVVDGSRRAAAPAVIAYLERRGTLRPGEREALSSFRSQHVKNVAGKTVGCIAADTIGDGAK